MRPNLRSRRPSRARGQDGSSADEVRLYARFTRTGANEFLVVNFRDDKTKLPFAMTDEEFIAGIDKLDAGALGIADGAEVYVDGEYGQTHDWAADSTGAAILASGSLGGRPDLHAWVRDRQSAFDALLASYASPGYAAAAQRADDVVRESRDDVLDTGDAEPAIPDDRGGSVRSNAGAAGDGEAAARERPAARRAARIEAIRLGTFDDAAGRYAVRTKLVEERKRKLGVAKIETTNDLAAAVADIGDAAVEHFYGIVTDAAGKPLVPQPGPWSG